MIVRNEENNLSQCLASVAGLFDEIVIVDTGSTDRTIEIARSFGARVFDFVWVDDFGAARNAALARATGDYAFSRGSALVSSFFARPRFVDQPTSNHRSRGYPRATRRQGGRRTVRNI
jgi:glycosyltransferase involved in cell wall biosynthesis